MGIYKEAQGWVDKYIASLPATPMSSKEAGERLYDFIADS
jgi:hypothetical protein